MGRFRQAPAAYIHSPLGGIHPGAHFAVNAFFTVMQDKLLFQSAPHNNQISHGNKEICVNQDHKHKGEGREPSDHDQRQDEDNEDEGHEVFCNIPPGIYVISDINTEWETLSGRHMCNVARTHCFVFLVLAFTGPEPGSFAACLTVFGNQRAQLSGLCLAAFRGRPAFFAAAGSITGIIG